LKIAYQCYWQAAWIVDDTDDEGDDSEDDNPDGAGMVIDEKDHSEHESDNSDVDAVSHFTEKFDQESTGGTEMGVSYPILVFYPMNILEHFNHSPGIGWLASASWNRPLTDLTGTCQ
jgi:hypothetical protein